MNNLEAENRDRIGRLYTNHHKWLLSVGTNITKNRTVADELVSDLYLYLAERINTNIWYEDTFNLMYCRAFIQTRWINRIKSEKRFVTHTASHDTVEEVYDEEFDKKLETAYTDIVNELRELERSKMWASSKLAQLYFFNAEMTLEQLASNIKISKSTAFLNIKKVKLHLKDKIENPFNSK